jgi:hypothetical protein
VDWQHCRLGNSIPPAIRPMQFQAPWFSSESLLGILFSRWMLILFCVKRHRLHVQGDLRFTSVVSDQQRGSSHEQIPEISNRMEKQPIQLFIFPGSSPVVMSRRTTATWNPAARPISPWQQYHRGYPDAATARKVNSARGARRCQKGLALRSGLSRGCLSTPSGRSAVSGV